MTLAMARNKWSALIMTRVCLPLLEICHAYTWISQRILDDANNHDQPEELHDYKGPAPLEPVESLSARDRFCVATIQDQRAQMHETYE